MYRSKRVIPDNLYLLKIDRGRSIQDALNQASLDLEIKSGRFTGIGAVNPLAFGYYDFNERYYKEIKREGIFELVSLIGNISLKDDRPFAHAHISAGDTNGDIFGGHLLPGTKAIVCEVIIESFEGGSLIRKFDENTGLHLWEL